MLQSTSLKFGLVIVAAGRGERAGNENGPKQYRALDGNTVIAKTLLSLRPAVSINDTVVVIHADDEEIFKRSIAQNDTNGIQITFGGKTRQISVYNGLKALSSSANPPTHVLIHDAARPFVTPQLLQALAEEAIENPNAGILPLLPIAETLKEAKDGLVKSTVDRNTLFKAQTPQLFPLNEIVACHERAVEEKRTDFTDDAALFEWQDMAVRAIDGEASNIKLTYPEDFPDNAKKAKTMICDVRTGNGYDVHRFGQGDHVILCGVKVPFDRSLDGHSDADVGFHALTDALLATCGAGDIGDHFPPNDPQWKGMDSAHFLQKAVDIVAENGGAILNADVSIIAEAPKLAPYKQAMRERLADILGIEVTRCSAKATTNEKIGFVGREEGIAAIATANVQYGVDQ